MGAVILVSLLIMNQLGKKPETIELSRYSPEMGQYLNHHQTAVVGFLMYRIHP